MGSVKPLNKPMMEWLVRQSSYTAAQTHPVVTAALVTAAGLAGLARLQRSREA